YDDDGNPARANIKQALDSNKDRHGGPMAGVDIDTLTMEQYLALSRENQALGVVKPEIEGNVNFEIKSQFMRELREDTFSGNKNEDAHDHIDQVRCQICEGPYLDKDCPLNEEVKQVKEVRYGELGRPTPFNRNNEEGKICRNNQKYIEEASMRQVKQDEWLKTFCHNLEKSQNHHDEIIQGLESRVTTLAKEIVTKTGKNEDCKEIFTNDGAPLYTPFYYSPKEIEYFLANSGFLDDDEFKNVTSIPDKDLKQTSPKQTTTHYIEPYVPPIPFPRRLEQHAEEALNHKTMESLKKIKVNRPFLKEIRQSDEYPKFMKDLVANKPLTMEDKDVRINRRCSALLLNQLPPKEKYHGSFILPCSIGRLDFNNALADLGNLVKVRVTA
ncbi:hypothetical protein Tco_1091777, partial [Tanacetum coccineum]